MKTQILRYKNKATQMRWIKTLSKTKEVVCLLHKFRQVFHNETISFLILIITLLYGACVVLYLCIGVSLCWSQWNTTCIKKKNSDSWLCCYKMLYFSKWPKVPANWMWLNLCCFVVTASSPQIQQTPISSSSSSSSLITPASKGLKPCL